MPFIPQNDFDDCIKTAKAEAKRFLDRIAAWEKRVKEDPEMRYGTKESGAITRASLDLSRVLADLRRPL
jgi:hypothetical protein